VNNIFYHFSYGLISVISVSAGLAGFYTDTIRIGLIGLIVGLSDVLSTMIGRYISDRTERQVKRSILKRIMLACKAVPHFFSEKIVTYMKQKEVSEEVAQSIAQDASSKPNLLNRFIIEEEYGFNPDDLGKPLKASIHSGLFRLVGTVAPLSPYFLSNSIPLSMVLSFIIGIFLFIFTGFILALSTDLDIKKKIMELIINGLVLTVLIFGLGMATSNFIRLLG
jgi:VIT1/CCC1 family predicted Fe2+/Mn2+ transporter